MLYGPGLSRANVLGSGPAADVIAAQSLCQQIRNAHASVRRLTCCNGSGFLLERVTRLDGGSDAAVRPDGTAPTAGRLELMRLDLNGTRNDPLQRGTAALLDQH